MHWFRTLYATRAAFPAPEIALKVGVALAAGLLVGFERAWANKDIGVRTFAMTSLMGLLGALLGSESVLLTGIAVLLIISFANLRTILNKRKLEATTSVALMIIYLLGVLVGQGHLFTPIACSIVVALLLSLKPQFRAFTGGLTQSELRGAIVLAMLGFIVWPLLPDRFIDPWNTIQPSQQWLTVMVVACLGFINYILLRVYGSRGLYLTSVLGGLVSSSAAVAALSTSLEGEQMVPLITPMVLITSVAMFVRNIVILMLFAPGAVHTAALPLLAMAAVAAIPIFRYRNAAEVKTGDDTSPIGLTSPLSLKNVLNFGLLFLIVQSIATQGQRWLGAAGFQVISVLGGLVSSASSTAAAANMAMHGEVSYSQAGVAAILTSMASALINLPIIYRKPSLQPAFRPLLTSSMLQICSGGAALLLQWRFSRIHF